MTVDFEDRVRDELHRALGAGPPCRGTWDDIENRGHDAARRRKRGGAACLVGLIVIALVAGIAATRHDAPVQVRSGPAPSSSTTVPPHGVRVSSTTDLGTDQVDAVVATPDAVWVSLWGPGEVLRIDPAGHVTARVPIGTAQNGPLALAAGEGSIWVLDFSTGNLVRIDPNTARVTGRLQLPAEPERVAVGNGKVWVTACCDRATPNQRLYRIDPQALTIEHEVALPGQGASENVGLNANGIFITGEQFTTMVQVDPSGTRVIGQIDLGDTTSSKWGACQQSVGAAALCLIPSSGLLLELEKSQRSALASAPHTIRSLTMFGPDVVVGTDEGLYLLDGAGWHPLGGPDSISVLTPSNGGLWALQGSHLVRLALH